ncbi:hypothetical protein NC652_000154 [Populus alba x Populus x berolinensis]|nr:hypothetical protein NC652_000154 [Populus alba x Populus x berolinensis]
METRRCMLNQSHEHVLHINASPDLGYRPLNLTEDGLTVAENDEPS